MFESQYTYKYVAQATDYGSSDAYGSDLYGAQSYSCANSDTICQTGGPAAPNTGFVANNPIFIGGVFITAALVITVIAYAIIKKVKQPKASR